jgi:hypothetical protein
MYNCGRLPFTFDGNSRYPEDIIMKFSSLSWDADLFENINQHAFSRYLKHSTSNKSFRMEDFLLQHFDFGVSAIIGCF